MAIKTLIYKNYFRLIMSVLAVWLIGGQTPVDSFWREGRTVVAATVDAYPDNPRAAALSRNRDRRLDWSFFHQTGVDVFLGYEMVNINDPDQNALWLKMFVHNHTPGFKGQWTEPLRVSPYAPDRRVASFSITAAYIQPRRFVCKFPSVFVAFITSDSDGSNSELQIKQYISSYSDHRIRLTENPEFNVRIKPSNAGRDIVNTHICPIDIQGFFSARTATHLCWEEMDRQTGRRRILVADVSSGDPSVEPHVLVDDIVSAHPLNPRLNAMSLVPQDSEDGIKLRGVVCWEQHSPVKAQSESGIHIRGYQTTDSGDRFKVLGPVIRLVEKTPDTVKDHPDVHINYETFNSSAAVVTWHSTVPGTEMKSIMAQTVWFDSDTDNARLFLLEDSADVLIPPQPFDTSSTVMDNAFCLPRGIDYDPSLARLVYCDQANHRVGWIDDPAPEQPGCWYSERVAAHGFRYRHTGEISRYFTDGDDPYFEIGQQLWTAFADATGGDFQIHAFNTEFDPVVSKTIHSGIVPGETSRVEDFTLVSDSYSSLYLFYTLRPSKGHRSICWNSDTLQSLGTGDEQTFYRFTHPYDVSVIPPAPRPMPHPNGYGGYTGCDGYGGYWVADMGGNRLLRMTRDGNIAAVTAPETVLAPHAVSAARDGSCWAIDWGRERVVKIDPHGNVVARTTPCANSNTPDGVPCIIHPSALDCGGDPDICYVADYEGNTVYKVSLDNGTLVLTRSETDYFRPFALEVVKTDTGNVLWVADNKSMAPTPVPGTWTPVVLPPATPTPPPGQRYTPLPSTPFPENFRISKNVFGEADTSQWPAAAPLNLSPVDPDHCWVADRDAGSYMNNEIRRLSPDGYTSIKGNVYHEVSMPIDVEYVRPGVTRPIPPVETRTEIQAKTPTEIQGPILAEYQAPTQAEFQDDTPVDTEAETPAKTLGENPESIANQEQPPDRDNPFIGFYCGHLEEHLPWCRRMHLGYSKNQMHNMIIPYLKTQNSVKDKHILKLVDTIENVYSKHNIIPWVSLSLNWIVAGFSTPDDVAVFFDQYGKAINDWFQILGTRLNHLNTEYDLKPGRYRFESEANVYRYTGKPVIYYEATRHIYPIFKRHLPDSSLVISIAATETYHVEAYLRPQLEYHRDHFPKEPLPFDGIQASCHGGKYMHSVDVHYFIQALFRDVFGDAEGMDRFNRLVFWSNENSGFAVGEVSTRGIVYATDRERARQDIKCITQYLSLPGTLMINVDRRLEGDRRPKSKDNYHNMNGLVQNGCGLFDRGKGFVSPAQDMLELFTRYVHDYRPVFNHSTHPVRIFDWVHRKDPGKHRLLIWREFGDAHAIETIPIPPEWKDLEQVWVINLITQTETLHPVDTKKMVIRLTVDDSPVLVMPYSQSFQTSRGEQ